MSLGVTCAICGKAVSPAEPVVKTSGCAFPQDHELWPYCDAPLHVRCLKSWAPREPFSFAYYDQRYKQHLSEGWLIVAEGDGWFLGHVPAGLFYTPPGMEDTVELRVSDWPVMILAHANQWTDFIAGGWRKAHPALVGSLAARVEKAVAEIARVLPTTESILARLRQTRSERHSPLEDAAREFTRFVFDLGRTTCSSLADGLATCTQKDVSLPVTDDTALEVSLALLGTTTACLRGHNAFTDSATGMRIAQHCHQSLRTDYGLSENDAQGVVAAVTGYDLIFEQGYRGKENPFGKVVGEMLRRTISEALPKLTVRGTANVMSPLVVGTLGGVFNLAATDALKFWKDRLEEQPAKEEPTDTSTKKDLGEKAEDAPISLRILMEALQRRLEKEYPQVLLCPRWSAFVLAGTVGGCVALAIRLHFDVPESERSSLELKMREVLQRRFPDSEQAYENCYHFVTDSLQDIARGERGKYFFILVAMWVLASVSEGNEIESHEHVVAHIADIYQNETIGFWDAQ